MTSLLRVVSPREVEGLRKNPVDPDTLQQAAAIVQDVRRNGDEALRSYAVRFDGLRPDDALVLERDTLERALAALPPVQRDLLQRTGQRIREFASQQKACFQPLATEIPGGVAGHELAPVERAGCYAPGGRYPLPSTVLMTAITARVAGVEEVWLASPRPQPILLAAAAIAGVDRVLAAGGAQAIAALAFGTGQVTACDVVVGPGNRWVTAAKQLVSGDVGIDMLAGPSELVVLADGSADARAIAADLLAQAEHDVDAVVVLVTTSSELIANVEQQLLSQLENLPTAGTAVSSLRRGRAVLCADMDEAAQVVNRLAPEHLQVQVRGADGDALRPKLRHYGALFLGPRTAQVLGDYGAGPNHVLPTGGGARHTGGLSVLNFLRVRTWMRVEDYGAARELHADTEALALLEGLPAHGRAANAGARCTPPT